MYIIVITTKKNLFINQIPTEICKMSYFLMLFLFSFVKSSLRYVVLMMCDGPVQCATVRLYKASESEMILIAK